MTEEPGLTALPGYAAALFLLCMMFYNRTCVSEMEGKDWWEVNDEWLEHHPIAYSVFRGLMLTDMVRKRDVPLPIQPNRRPPCTRLR